MKIFNSPRPNLWHTAKAEDRPAHGTAENGWILIHHLKHNSFWAKDSAFQKVAKAKPELGETHMKTFPVHLPQGVLPVGPKSPGDVVFVPGKNADRFTDGDQLEAQLHLAAEPDMVAHHPVLGWVGATLPDFPPEKKGTGLNRHMPIRVDGAGNGDLVEEVEKVQLAIQHDGGAEDGVGPGLIQFFKGVG